MTARAFPTHQQPPRGQQHAVVKYELTAAQVEQEQMVLARLDQQRAMIETYLPKGTDLEQVKTDIALAVRKVPKILDCTPESILIAAAEIQRWGLQIGVTAYLVPYGAECTPVADYKGLEELVIGSGVVRALHKHAVYANEEFSIELGTKNEVRHIPMWKGGERGPLVGAYCVAVLGGYQQVITYMRIDEIEAIRAKSKQWNAQTSRLATAPEWYCIKSAVRRSCKTLPKNPRLASLMQKFDAADQLEFGGNPDATADIPEGEYEVMKESTPAGGSRESATRPSGEGETTAADGGTSATRPSSPAARGHSDDPPPSTGSDSPPATPIDTTTVEYARAWRFPFEGHPRHNVRLEDFSTNELTELARWASGKVDEAVAKGEKPRPRHFDTMTFAERVLDARIAEAKARVGPSMTSPGAPSSFDV